ncbi:hypothetical protein Scep_012522 [Stephania cephalantha]|uniref:Viral late gene transcription factor 3 zinc ribbon domain-containing protein n=1 Tax=Stephania cephalantha TaxID=152367 RepID=A0AAP0JFG6_9MAGN
MMETSFSSAILINRVSKNSCKIGIASVNPNFRPNLSRSRCKDKLLMGSCRNVVGVSTIGEAAVTAEPSQVEITWQIVVGALAGATPFVVAGIEFSKRIVAQRTCGVCKGSGLVQRDKYYFRCPRCGGFLPWQSWKRFFSG